MTISPPKIRIFPFLSVISTDKPVNRSKHAYALTQLNFFPLRSFFLSWYSQRNKEGVWANRTTKYNKKSGGKMYSHTRTLGAEVHKSNIRVTIWHKKHKILHFIERHKFRLSDLLTNSNRTTLQFRKVEEQTLRTPCICLQIIDIFRFKNRATIRHW